MAYDLQLAERIRSRLSQRAGGRMIEEKKMFRGLTFMVNDKMCISVSGDRLMCRFDPALQETAAAKDGFSPMIMKGKQYRGFGYVDAAVVPHREDLDYWIGLCLDFNDRAKAAPKRKSRRK